MSGEIRDFRKSDQQRTGPKIMGAAVAGNPIVLDSRTPQEQAPVEINVHVETVTEADGVRRPKRKKDEPEIRLRVQPSRNEWERVKRLEDE